MCYSRKGVCVLKWTQFTIVTDLTKIGYGEYKLNLSGKGQGPMGTLVNTIMKLRVPYVAELQMKRSG
jgi:hypothetical protein